MEVSVKYVNGMHFEGRGSSPVTVSMDAMPGFGGQGQGATPMELLLMSVAGCSGIDVVSILEKMRVQFERFEMEVQGDRAADHPKVFTSIRLVYRFWGTGLDEGKVRRAVELSLEKYCSVSNTINKAAKISYSLEINPHTRESDGPV